jgi:predicted GNAT family N-acyltransferase
MKKLLRTDQLHDREIKTYFFQDAYPDLDPIFSLWYNVYIEELGYNLPADHSGRHLRAEPNGSFIVAAFDQEVCVGSIRISGNDHCQLEFSYEEFFEDRPIVEITKLIIAQEYRKTALKTWLIHEAQSICLKKYGQYFICINSSEKLVLFYRLMNFRKLTESPVIHPVIGNKSYLMGTESESLQYLPIAKQPLPTLSAQTSSSNHI